MMSFISVRLTIWKIDLLGIIKVMKSIEYVLSNKDCIEDNNHNYGNRQRP